MPPTAFTNYLDAAQVTLYAFWFFFAGLVYYLRQEDKREGYPLRSDRTEMSDRITAVGYPPMPPTKAFVMYDGHVSTSPQTEPPSGPLAAVPAARFPGAPLVPTGNPMLDGIGPGSWVPRRDEPDLTIDGRPRIRPLRVATEYGIEKGTLDPLGMEVIGLDGRIAGYVVDLWIDEVEHRLRYLEVELTVTPEPIRVLLPEGFVRYRPRLRVVKVNSILAEQFADVPRLRDPDQITFREEERIVAYYGGGYLYATPSRLGPLL